MSTINGPLEGFIHLTVINADWDFATNFPQNAQNGLQVDWISFSAGAAGDKCALKHKTDTGPLIFPLSTLPAQGVAEKVYYGNRRIYPFLDVSDGTFNAGATLIIKLK